MCVIGNKTVREGGTGEGREEEGEGGREGGREGSLLTGNESEERERGRAFFSDVPPQLRVQGTAPEEEEEKEEEDYSKLTQ